MKQTPCKYRKLCLGVLKRTMAGLSWLFLAVMLFVALNLKTPYLSAYRQYETPVILFVCAVLYLVYFRKTRAFYKVAAYITLLTVFILTCVGEGRFQYRRHVVLNHPISVAGSIGEHFIVGYEDVGKIVPLVRQGLVGGIFITRRNMVGKDFEMLRQEIAMLQQLRTEADLPQLIVTTDQEGGVVSHMSPPLERMPALASVVSEGASIDAVVANAQAYGQIQGKGLAALGITVNLSPVVDLMPQETLRGLDFHSRIGLRAISSDPEVVTEVAAAYIRGLRTQGVHGTLKHFPGLGRVSDDTHHFSAILDTPIEELQRSDWLPFRNVGKQEGVLMMVGHVTLSALDKEHPASFSKPVVQGIIRDNWQHEGVLITDDLTMRAAYRHGICQATIKALNAGMDLVLISYDYEKFYDAFYCVSQAYEEGILDRIALNRSHERLTRLLN